jgi:uncharacterized protein
MIHFKKLRNCFALFLAFSAGATSSRAADVAHGKAIPRSPYSYVYDEGNVLSSDARNELYRILSSENQMHGNQVLVAIFNSLDGEDLVDYTSRVFKAWKPGQKDKSNGILVAAYLKEHQLRIEVGYGLEPYVTDAKSKGIILNDLMPNFRDKNYDAGVKLAVAHLLEIIHQGEGTSADSDPSVKLGNTAYTEVPLGIKIVGLALLVGFIILLCFTGSPGRLLLLQMIQLIFNLLFLFGGRGGGDGDGGFSGGGGSSGGGGASGSW